MDVFFTIFTGYAVFIVFGGSNEVLNLILFYSGAYNIFVHANIDFRMGLFNYIFSSPELHRWHHSNKSVEANNNYGSVFIIWDLIFKTWFLPKKSISYDSIGLQTKDQIGDSFLHQTLYPFKRKPMI